MKYITNLEVQKFDVLEKKMPEGQRPRQPGSFQYGPCSPHKNYSARQRQYWTVPYGPYKSCIPEVGSQQSSKELAFQKMISGKFEMLSTLNTAAKSEVLDPPIRSVLSRQYKRLPRTPFVITYFSKD